MASVQCLKTDIPRCVHIVFHVKRVFNMGESFQDFEADFL